MAIVKSIVEDQEREKKKKNLILIPFLDEILPEIEGLEAIMSIIGAAGNTALAIQGIFANPVSAPMDILGFLTEGSTRYEDDYASMAKTRKGISSDDLTKIGNGFKKADDQLQRIIKHECKL